MHDLQINFNHINGCISNYLSLLILTICLSCSNKFRATLIFINFNYFIPFNGFITIFYKNSSTTIRHIHDQFLAAKSSFGDLWMTVGKS